MAELSSYLLSQNRPFNNTNLVDSMAAKLKVGKTAVTKALDTLESESLVQACRLFDLRACFFKSIKLTDPSQVKEFGKVKIYLAKQDAFDVPSPEELADMDAQIALLKEQFAAASEQHKILQAELKGVESALSDEQLQIQLAEFQTTSDTLEQKLLSLKNPEPGAPPPISAEQMSSIEKSLAKFSTEWKKRKRICCDVLNKFSEQNGKKIRVIGEEIGIEFDEDVGAVLSPTPTVSAPSRGPPSAMAGRVYPPVVAAKVNAPAKIAPIAAVKPAAIAAKPSAKASSVAPVKPVTANKAAAKAPAPKAGTASNKKAQPDSDSDSDSDSVSESGSASPNAGKKKPATVSKATPAAAKGKTTAKSTTAKPAAAKAVSKPAAKKAAKSKAKSDSESESSSNSSDDSESSDSDSTPMVKSAASKTPRAAAAKASATISKKAKVDSDSDFEQ